MRVLVESPWPERAALLAVVSFFAAVCLHGVADFWAYGHNGFMGAQFAQAARNTLRFCSLGQAVFHLDLAPPAPGSFYVNHPQLLHWHLVLFHSLLGDSEWVTRLTPVIYNLATLLLLFLSFRRWCGRAAALAVTASYSLIPLQMSFGNLVSHEPGGVFWSLTSASCPSSCLRASTPTTGSSCTCTGASRPCSTPTPSGPRSRCTA